METFVGFGVLFCYISIGKYIDYSPKYSLFYRTFSNSMSNFIPSFLAILPVFIAFTFLGLCLFWNSERFTSVSDIMKGLFALFLGDSIHDIVVAVSVTVSCACRTRTYDLSIHNRSKIFAVRTTYMIHSALVFYH